MKKKIRNRFTENEARLMMLEEELDLRDQQIAMLTEKCEELERMLKFNFLIDEIRRDMNLFQTLGILADEFCYYDKRERIDAHLEKCEKYDKMIPMDVKEFFHDTGDKEDIII